jgi:hypothetical protein
MRGNRVGRWLPISAVARPRSGRRSGTRGRLTRASPSTPKEAPALRRAGARSRPNSATRGRRSRVPALRSDSSEASARAVRTRPAQRRHVVVAASQWWRWSARSPSSLTRRSGAHVRNQRKLSSARDGGIGEQQHEVEPVRGVDLAGRETDQGLSEIRVQTLVRPSTKRRLPRRARSIRGSNAACRGLTPDPATPIRAVTGSGVDAFPVEGNRSNRKRSPSESGRRPAQPTSTTAPTAAAAERGYQTGTSGSGSPHVHHRSGC